MESLLAPTAGVLIVLLIAPLLAVAGVVLLLTIGHVFPRSPSLSRATFNCPFSKRRATVEFLSSPGAAKPTDVLSCSVFDKPYHVRCKKGCLAMAETGWMPSPLMPRFALLADGVAYRTADPPEGPAPDGPPREAVLPAA